jgi:hypothetical protein
MFKLLAVTVPAIASSPAFGPAASADQAIQYTSPAMISAHRAVPRTKAMRSPAPDRAAVRARSPLWRDCSYSNVSGLSRVLLPEQNHSFRVLIR